MPTLEAEGLPPAIKDLLFWAESNRATLNPKAEVYVSPTFGVSLRVKESAAHAQGDGSKEATGLPAHSSIVSAPYTTSLSYINALDAFPPLAARSPRFPQKFLDEVPAKVIGCYFLMQQFLLGEKSFWAPYIRSLPQPDEPEKLGTPLYWPEEARSWLRGSNLGAAALHREESWKEELDNAARVFWNGCLEMLYARQLEKPAHELYGKLYNSGKDEETLKLYKWACTIFSSRSFVSTLIPPEVYGAKLDKVVKEGSTETWREFIKKEGPYPVLFPLVDIANHSPSAKVEWFADAKSEIKTVSIKNDVEIKAGDQIFNNYAPKGNSELLLGYGFMIPDNDDFAIEMRVSAPHKVALLNVQCNGSQGENGRWLFHIKLKPYPNAKSDVPEDLRIFEPGLLNMLSVLVANEHEEAEFAKHSNQGIESAFDEKLDSPALGRNCVAVLAMLKKRLEILLEKLVLTPAGMKPKSGKTETEAQFVKMARQYRTGQLKVLVNGIGFLHKRLIPTICKDTVESFRHEEWPQDPCITLSTAYKFLAEVRPEIYRKLRSIVCSSVNLPSGIPHDDSTAADPVWIEDVMRSAEEDEYEKGEDTGVQREVLWALWVTAILHIDENITQKSEFWPDNLANWVQEMLDVYQIRPLPTDDDVSHRVLTTYTASLVRANIFELMPRKKKLMYWNMKKPKLPMLDDDSSEEAMENMLEDYWQKLAVVALKIVRGETFMGMGTLKRMVIENGMEHEVLVKKEDTVLFVRRDNDDEDED